MGIECLSAVCLSDKCRYDKHTQSPLSLPLKLDSDHCPVLQYDWRTFLETLSPTNTHRLNVSPDDRHTNPCWLNKVYLHCKVSAKNHSIHKQPVEFTNWWTRRQKGTDYFSGLFKYLPWLNERLWVTVFTLNPSRKFAVNNCKNNDRLWHVWLWEICSLSFFITQKLMQARTFTHKRNFWNSH